MPTGRAVSSVTISAEMLCWFRSPRAAVASVVGLTVFGARGHDVVDVQLGKSCATGCGRCRRR